ncbi:cutinase family protein [Frankia sp. CNm7]|uniref:Cutinase family protein n=1 Tax=Frankia nepalensis TaxID=1836974 RepID=A0A937RK27_9ACTN|nr:cutinase family protein [Frankia nepalensis]MBL7494799.1 cutinase family protein [Frankia nepalensis]MBL7514327.1 cutinase family protein [Frankia nepalensis]MBL7519594.1 cutinase family protein [Frankia nepalensis]MBL7631745.1 cutinase family protein [Frankia nepalensis]
MVLKNGTLITFLAMAAGVAGGVSGCPGSGSTPTTPTGCADVEVVFARGSGELPGLGITGGPFVSSLKANLPGKTVTSYAVNYAADIAQTSAGAGATDMTRHVTSVAAKCPNTDFVLGGYSQGASVTDIAIGIPTLLGRGETIPTNLAPRVAAVVVFGNPLALYGQHIPTASKLYGSKAREYCALGDPVCAGGVNGAAHLTYASSGMTTQGAVFAAGKVTGT